MAKAPAFQFYAKEWLSSPRVMLMTPEQEGAYIRLLAYCWDSGDCALPSDDNALALLSRIGKRWLKGVGKPIRECFTDHPSKPGFLTNVRLLTEHRKQEEWRKKCAKGGKGSSTNGEVNDKGSSRSSEVNGNTAFASALAPAIASEDSTPNPLPSPTGIAIPTELDTEAFRAAWGQWRAYRVERKPKLTPSSEKMQLKKLSRYGPAAAIGIIELAIEKTWIGLVYPEERHGGNNTPRGGLGRPGRAEPEPGKYAHLTRNQGDEAPEDQAGSGLFSPAGSPPDAPAG